MSNACFGKTTIHWETEMLLGWIETTRELVAMQFQELDFTTSGNEQMPYLLPQLYEVQFSFGWQFPEKNPW